MKQYKIGLGTCGGRAICTSIIKAHDEREAVIKYLESMNEDVTEENINTYIQSTFEHIPQPRKAKEIVPISEPDIEKLQDICGEVVDIEEGLMYGMIDFRYDNLMSAMKPGHPMEILDSILANIYFTIQRGNEPAIKDMEEILKKFKSFKSAFDVKEMNKPIKELSEYIKGRKLYLESK